MKKIALCTLAFAALMPFAVSAATPQAPAAKTQISTQAVQGDVFIVKPDGTKVKMTSATKIEAGDKIVTGTGSVTLTRADGSHIYIGPNTSVTIASNSVDKAAPNATGTNSNGIVYNTTLKLDYGYVIASAANPNSVITVISPICTTVTTNGTTKTSYDSTSLISYVTHFEGGADVSIIENGKPVSRGLTPGHTYQISGKMVQGGQIVALSLKEQFPSEDDLRGFELIDVDVTEVSTYE